MSRKYDTNTEAREVVDDLSASIAGTTVLVTGVSPGGLGAFFAEQIARAQPKLLILAGRSVAKLQATAEVIQKTGTSTKLLELDLSRLAHVRGSAEKVNTWQDVSVIDVLVNNAGIMAVDYEKTEDGFEKQFATNHLGPFLFTNLIIPKILASGKPRIVNVSSDGHRLSPVRFADYGFHVRLVNAGMRAMELTKSQDGENYDRWLAYGQSKTANILHAVSLAHKLGPKGLTAISLHPGVIRTNLSTHIDWEKDFKELRKVDRFFGNFEGWKDAFDFKSPERGVTTHVYAAFEPDLASHNGAYVLDGHIADPKTPTETLKPWATSEVEAELLWRLSEKLVGQEFAF